jgi:hypothetical protein
MRSLRKLIGIVLLAAVASFGVPGVLADGPQESPGVVGPQESPGVLGPQESPGFTTEIITSALQLLSSI